MAVRQLPNGRWQVDLYGRGGDRVRRNFKTKREADAWRVGTETQISSGSFRADAFRMNVDELAEEFLRHCEDRYRRKERMTRATLNGYRRHIENQICNRNQNFPFRDGIGALKLGTLTNRAILEFRDRLRSHGTSVPNTRSILRTAHVMFEFGRMDDFIGTNPVHGVRVHGRRDEGSRKVAPPSKSVVQTALRAAPEHVKVPATVAAATGVRIGELRALRYRHFDFERRLLRIETRVDAWNEEDGHGTKSTAGVRTIPLSQDLLDIVTQWRMSSRFQGNDDLVFPNGRGSYSKYETMADQLAKLFIDLPELPRFRWHQLRHFAISSWIEAGLSPKTVQTFAGHASMQTTLDRYGHLFPSDSHWAAMDRIAHGWLPESDAEFDGH